MNEEEKQQFKELKEEAKQKSYERTTVEKTKFFLENKKQDNEMVHKQQILERKEN